MIKFESQYDESYPKVTIELHSDSTLQDVVKAFEDFIKAAGYSYEGRLDIVRDEVN